MNCNILIIGNEIHIAQEIQGILEKQDAVVDVTYSGLHGIANAQQLKYDLIILDLVLPEMRGIEVLTTLREISSTPIAMIASKNNAEELSKCFGAGANGYITKPISVKELLDKTNALLGIQKKEVITKSIFYGDIELNLDDKTLACASTLVSLQDREFQIMALFIYTPEEIFSKQQIIDKFWGENSGLENNNIEVHVSRIRKKLQAIGSNTNIRTARGVGYALTMRR